MCRRSRLWYSLHQLLYGPPTHLPFLNESNSGDWWQWYFTLFLTYPEFGRYEFSCRHVADRSTPLHYSLTNADFSLQCSSSLDVLSLVYPPYIIQGYL